MALTSGTKLGPYEIQSSLGAGGMGEVYRAKDTRLDRTVAVKILPVHLSSNVEAKQRFEREARAISSLSHPNICMLFDVGHQNGTDFLVMEYLEGETLADRLRKGPLPADQVLKYGIDICEGLEKAHKSGVIHRDLKPGNIMLTKSGAKLMDFGLAKSTPSQQPPPSSSLTMTISGPSADSPLTAQGTVVGTFQYMAPEQLEGKEADARSDIFALGAVLYEMASGRRAFSGKSQASIVAAILASDPQPISAVQPMSPPALDRVVRTCMAKDPDERWQTAHDVRLQLEWIAEAGSKAGVPAPVIAKRRISQRLAWGIAAVATLAAIALGIGFILRAPAPIHPMRLSILPPEKHTFDPFSLALSPDGTKLAFVAGVAGSAPQLWVRPLDSIAAQPLAGTEDALFPFWSPDSHSIGFFAQGKLKIIGDSSGGAVQTLADAPQPRGGSWGSDGTILFTPDALSPMLRIPAVGGTASHAIGDLKSAASLGSPRWPVFLPDGKHYIFFQFATDSEGGGNIHLGELGSEQDTILQKSDFRAYYANGRLIYVQGGNLMAQQFDERKLKSIGNPVPIAEQVRSEARGAAAFSVSHDGKLVFAGGQSTTLDLAWYDRTGKKGDIIDTGTFQDLHISPDGKKVAAARLDAGGHLEIYLYDLVRGTKSQFSFSQSRDDDPVWSPDGNTIVFDSARSGRIDLYTRPANGSRQEELLYHDDLDKYPYNWSADGKYVSYETISKGHFDIWVFPMFGDRRPFPYIQEKFNARYPTFSPDGKWMAFTSFESGHGQIYVVAFPKPGGRFLVGDGVESVWSRHGKEILYVDDHSNIASVEAAAHGDSMELGKPQILFPVQPAQFEASPDGNRLLMMQAPIEISTHLTLVVNWPQELRK
ncbi:MAG TPA: protein kinase [Terriglobales bacterium]|nr:protein kinase [Terriglobales bacterium]